MIIVYIHQYELLFSFLEKIQIGQRYRIRMRK